MRTWLAQIAKLALVVALLYLLGTSGYLSMELTRRALSHHGEMLLAGGLLLATVLMCSWRWRQLLRAQGISLSLARVTALTFVGNFFNLALPGAVSGDFVKAFYIGREAPERRGLAFGSILFDRVMGLSALVIVSAAALAFTMDGAKDGAIMKSVQALVFALAGGFCLFYAYLFVVRPENDIALRLLKSLEARVPRLATVAQIYLGVRHFHDHRITVLGTFLVSVAIHLTLGVVFLALARALGEGQLSLPQVYSVVPTGILISTIPVAPAGLGTGHAAFLVLFRLVGSERGADMFTLYAMGNIVLGCVGGLLYLRLRSTQAAPSA